MVIKTAVATRNRTSQVLEKMWRNQNLGCRACLVSAKETSVQFLGSVKCGTEAQRIYLVVQGPGFQPQSCQELKN